LEKHQNSQVQKLFEKREEKHQKHKKNLKKHGMLIMILSLKKQQMIYQKVNQQLVILLEVLLQLRKKLLETSKK